MCRMVCDSATHRPSCASGYFYQRIQNKYIYKLFNRKLLRFTYSQCLNIRLMNLDLITFQILRKYCFFSHSNEILSGKFN